MGFVERRSRGWPEENFRHMDEVEDVRSVGAPENVVQEVVVVTGTVQHETAAA
jgi:hypothetical protein